MSQHKYRVVTPGHGPIEIQLGWDRPMQWFYAVVSPVDVRHNDLGDPLYSNLDDSQAPAQDLGYFVRLVYERFGVELPRQMVNAVNEDRQANAVSREVVY